jgi:hypothetical protein
MRLSNLDLHKKYKTGISRTYKQAPTSTPGFLKARLEKASYHKKTLFNCTSLLFKKQKK